MFIFAQTNDYMLSTSEENYIKTIYHLAQPTTPDVSTNSIARRLDTKASSVTDMIKKLADKGLVNYQKYQGASLTERGMHIAKMIVRKHRLWEAFLVEKLDFNWDEVHEVAEQLEHIQSEKLINRLDAFLDYPKEDPHGDPIPNAEGEITAVQKTLLAELEEGQTGVCVGVKDTSPSFLQYLDKQKVALGTTIQLLSKEHFDQSVNVLVDDRELVFSKMVSNNIYIQKK